MHALQLVLWWCGGGGGSGGGDSGDWMQYCNLHCVMGVVV